jgi:hypothetical protein
MHYAILAYHEEAVVASWSPNEDSALMRELLDLNDRLVGEGRMGPAARLGGTGGGVTLRKGTVIDGPFAETKEQLLGLYVVRAGSLEEAVGIARDLARVNRTAVYEIRPIELFVPGADVAE